MCSHSDTTFHQNNGNMSGLTITLADGTKHTLGNKAVRDHEWEELKQDYTGLDGKVFMCDASYINLSAPQKVKVCAWVTGFGIVKAVACSGHAMNDSIINCCLLLKMDGTHPTRRCSIRSKSRSSLC